DQRNETGRRDDGLETRREVEGNDDVVSTVADKLVAHDEQMSDLVEDDSPPRRHRSPEAPVARVASAKAIVRAHTPLADLRSCVVAQQPKVFRPDEAV